jgi:hypothetical protein
MKRNAEENVITEEVHTLHEQYEKGLRELYALPCAAAPGTSRKASALQESTRGASKQLGALTEE